MEDQAQVVTKSYQYMPKPPSWITKWGISLITLVFICFLTAILTFPYPNTLDGEITVLIEGQKPHVGVIKVASKKLNHLAIGQKVSIHLHRYPFSTFGALMGNVSYISDERGVSGLHDITVVVDSLVTTHNKVIPSNIKLEGKAIVRLPESSLFKMLLNHTNK